MEEVKWLSTAFACHILSHTYGLNNVTKIETCLVEQERRGVINEG